MTTLTTVAPVRSQLGTVLRRLAPRGVRRMLQAYRASRESDESIWEGVYAHYRDVPVFGEGLFGRTWIDMARAEAASALSQGTHARRALRGLGGDQSLLPLLAAVVCHATGRLRVLDFGGGMGIDYVHVLQCADCPSLEYLVIESREISHRARELFAGDSRIRFHTSVPEDPGEIDIVHIDSALQYVEDYRGLLDRLCTYGAEYFLFVRLAAGDVPTYATAQTNLPGTRLAYWVVNLAELVDIMAAHGYLLKLKVLSDQPLRTAKIPERYRIERTCNLLFARVRDAEPRG